MAFGAVWLGFRGVGTISIDPFTQSEILVEQSLNNVHVINGTTRVSRLLIRYRLETELSADDTDQPSIPWPVDVGVGYFPAPDGESGWQPGELGGGASWRETAQWRPQSVARSGVPSTKWWAQPEDTRSTPAQRIIHDKSTANLYLRFGFVVGVDGITTPDFLPRAVTGWMQVDYLLSNAII